MRLLSAPAAPANDFFILATGTADFSASAFERQVRAMREYPDSFRYGDSEAEGNLTYRIKEGYTHDGVADGKIDPAKLQAIAFDPVRNGYLVLRERIGNAFSDGAKLK